MSSVMNNVKRALEHAQAGNAEYEKAASILGGGPSSYYFEKIDEYVTALFERFAPFRVGDRVALAAVPKTKGTGWSSCAHFLISGAEGEVHSVDYRDGHFVADVMFDRETWLDGGGHEQPVTLKHVFCLPDYLLSRIERAEREGK